MAGVRYIQYSAVLQQNKVPVCSEQNWLHYLFARTGEMQSPSNGVNQLTAGNQENFSIPESMGILHQTAP